MYLAISTKEKVIKTDTYLKYARCFQKQKCAHKNKKLCYASGGQKHFKEITKFLIVNFRVMSCSVCHFS